MENCDIIDFAVNILGCGCDSSVFSLIEKSENVKLNCGIMLDKKILIGKRLLIYIASVDSLEPCNLLDVVLEGRAERDNMRYNRLRLVIVTDNTDEQTDIYKNEFACLKEKDDKIHIHVVKKEDSI